MEVLRRVSWLRAVRHCPYRSPDWSFTVSLWLILIMFLRLTWYCGKAALRRRAAAWCLCTCTPPALCTAYFLWYCPHTWGKTQRVTKLFNLQKKVIYIKMKISHSTLWKWSLPLPPCINVPSLASSHTAWTSPGKKEYTKIMLIMWNNSFPVFTTFS